MAWLSGLSLGFKDCAIHEEFKGTTECVIDVQRSEYGKICTEYPDTIVAIHNLTDDAIFFSHLLCGDLRDHGITVLGRYKARFKDDSQSVSKPDFSDAKNAGLFPEEAKYQDWLRRFGKGG